MNQKPIIHIVSAAITPPLAHGVSRYERDTDPDAGQYMELDEWLKPRAPNGWCGFDADGEFVFFVQDGDGIPLKQNV